MDGPNEMGWSAAEWRGTLLLEPRLDPRWILSGDYVREGAQPPLDVPAVLRTTEATFETRVTATIRSSGTRAWEL